MSLPDDEPEAVEGLLYYLYTFGYPKSVQAAAFGEAKRACSISKCNCARTKAPCRNAENTNKEQFLRSFSTLYWMFDLGLFQIAHKYDVRALMDLALHHLHDLLDDRDAMWRQRFRALSFGYVLAAEFLHDTEIPELAEMREEFLCSTAKCAAWHANINPISKLVDDNPSLAKHWLRHLAIRRDHDGGCKGSCLRPRKNETSK